MYYAFKRLTKHSLYSVITFSLSFLIAFVLPLISPFRGMVSNVGIDIVEEVSASNVKKVTLNPSKSTFTSNWVKQAKWDGSLRRYVAAGNFLDTAADPDYNTGWAETYLKFNFNLGDGAIVKKAELKLYKYAHGGTNSNHNFQLEARRATKDINMNHVPYNLNAWVSKGPEVYDTETVDHWDFDTAPIVWNVTSLVSKWNDGTFPNHGFVMHPQNPGPIEGAAFCSGHVIDGTCPSYKRPVLEIEYVINQAPFTPEPILPANQSEFGGSCDESVVPATGNCRLGEEVNLKLSGVGDGDPSPGRHKEVHFAGTNKTTSDVFDVKVNKIQNANDKQVHGILRNFADGVYDWYGYSIDEQNTRGKNSVVFNFMVDTTPPAVPTLEHLPEFVPAVGIENTVQFEITSDKVSDNVTVDTEVEYILQYSKTPDFTSDVFEKLAQRFAETDPRIELGPKGIDEIEGTADDITEDTAYYFRTKTRDALGNTSAWSGVVSSTIDSVKPTVTDVFVTPTRISPQNDSSVGEYDALEIAFNYTEEHTNEVGFEILNNAYEVIHRFTETPTERNQVDTLVETYWDGLNELGEVVTDGDYIVRPYVTDLAGNSVTIKESEHQRLFTIDNTGVDVIFNQQEDLWVKNAAFTLTGQVQDVGDLAAFDFRADSADAWEEAASVSGLNYDENTDQFSFDTTLTEGFNDFFFRTTDIVANEINYELIARLDSIKPEISTFDLTHSETAEVQDIFPGEPVLLNDYPPKLSFTLTDADSGIPTGTNPEGITLEADYQLWDRENQEYVDQTKKLFDKGVNLDYGFNSDLICNPITETFTRNGIEVASEVLCQTTFVNLGDTTYSFDLSFEDLVGNKNETSSREIEIDAYVYSEIRAPQEIGIYPTKSVEFVGFASKDAEVAIKNNVAGVDFTFEVREDFGLVDTDLTIVCGTFINHDDNPYTIDEEVCRWEITIEQYFDGLLENTENTNLVTVSDEAENVVTHELKTTIDLGSFEVAISPSALYVSPNGDGFQDDVTFIHFVYNPDDPYNKPEVRNTELEIRNSDGEIVRTFKSNGDLSVFTYWDLLIEQEVALRDSFPDSYPVETELVTAPDGEYTYVLTVESTDGIIRTSGEKKLFVNAVLEDTTVISTPLNGTETTNGVVTIQGQAPSTVAEDTQGTHLRGQVYANICIDTLVPEGTLLPEYITFSEIAEGYLTTSYPGSYPINFGQGNNVGCDHWQEVLVDENGFFTSIILFPEIEGLSEADHIIKAYSRDDYGNSTPYSNEVKITIESAQPFIEVSVEPTLTGITSEADYEKFLNGDLTIDDIRALRLRSVVVDGTEQVELSFADYTSLNVRPDAPSFNYIATLTDLKESDPALNPYDVDHIKYNHNKLLGDPTIPYANCQTTPEASSDELSTPDTGTVGCVWDYLIPMNEEYGGIYEVKFKGKRGTVIEEMTRGFQVDGRIPPAPVFMIVEKWDAVNETWVKMENVDYENFTDISKIRFRGAAEPGTQVELWTADEVDEEGNVVKPGVKYVDMIVDTTGVWEFIIDLEEYIDNGGNIDGLPGGPGDANPGEECTGIECLRARLGFILKGFKVDRDGKPVQVDEDGNPETVESEGTITVNYDRSAPKLLEVERLSEDRTMLGWAQTGDQAVFNMSFNEQLFISEIIKEDGFVRQLTKLSEELNEEGEIVREDWTGVINVDDPKEGMYNIGIRVKDLAENKKVYKADKFQNYKVDDFRIFIDNTAPDGTEFVTNTTEWSETWEQGGVNAGTRYLAGPTPEQPLAYQLPTTYEQGRTNPGYVTKADSVTLRGTAEYGQRVELFVAEPLLDENGELIQTDDPLVDRGGAVIATIPVSAENCVAYDFNKVTEDGLTTKFNINCDWAYDYAFPDNGANNWDGVPLHGYVLQARVIDSAANESEWSNTVIVYHDTDKPRLPSYSEITSPSYEENIPDYFIGQSTEDQVDKLPITKDTTIRIETNAERFTDFNFSGIKSGDSTAFHTDFFVNDSNRLHDHDVNLGTQSDQRDECMVMQGTRRVGTCEDGTYVFTSQVTDAVGFTSEPVSIAIERDTVIPVDPNVNLSMQGFYTILMSINGEAEAVSSALGSLNENGFRSGGVMTLDLYNDNHWERFFTFCSDLTDRAGNTSGTACDTIKTPIRPVRPGECDMNSERESKFFEIFNGNATVGADANIFYEIGFSKSCVTYELDTLQQHLLDTQTEFSQLHQEAFDCVVNKTKPVEEGGEAKDYATAVSECDTGSILGEDTINALLLNDEIAIVNVCIQNKIGEGAYYKDAINDCNASDIFPEAELEKLEANLCVYHDAQSNGNKSGEAIENCNANDLLTDAEINGLEEGLSEHDEAVQEGRDYEAKPWYEKLGNGIVNGVTGFVTGIGDMISGLGETLVNVGESIVSFVGDTVEAGISLANNAAAGLAALTESALTGADLADTYNRNVDNLRSLGLPVNDPLQDLQQIGTAVAVTTAIAATVAIAVVAAPFVLPAITAAAGAIASVGAAATTALASLAGGGTIATMVAGAVVTIGSGVLVDMGINAGIAGYQTITQGGDFTENFANVTCGDSVPGYAEPDLASCAGYILGGSLSGEALGGVAGAIPSIVDAGRTLARAQKYADELADLGKLADVASLRRIELPSGMKWADMDPKQIDNLLEVADSGVNVNLSKISNLDNIPTNLTNFSKVELDNYFTVVGKGFDDVPIETVAKLELDKATDLSKLTPNQTKNVLELAESSDGVLDMSKVTLMGDDAVKYGDEILATGPNGKLVDIDQLDDISHISDDILGGKLDLPCVLASADSVVIAENGNVFTRLKRLVIPQVNAAAGKCKMQQISDRWYAFDGVAVDIKNVDHLTDDSFLKSFDKLEGVDNFLSRHSDLEFGDRLSVLNGWMESNVDDQIHHVMTNKGNTYATQMKSIAENYGLDLDGDWNKISIAHTGSHPNAYHDWILNEMDDIVGLAGNDSKQFLDLFETKIKSPVVENPSLLRKEPWNWDVDVESLIK